jgi:hypothetical protein
MLPNETASSLSLVEDEKRRLDRRLPAIHAFSWETDQEGWMKSETTVLSRQPESELNNNDFDPRSVLLPPVCPEEVNQLSEGGLVKRFHWFHLGRIAASKALTGQATEDEDTASESSSSASKTFTSASPPSRCPTRLLRLLPGDADTPLSCEIFQPTWMDIERYILLHDIGSAGVRTMWEHTTKRNIFITDNLYRTLLIIRNNIGSRSLSLWIDSVCIDHSCLLEKSRIMAKLEDIYWNAFGVVRRKKTKVTICVRKYHPLLVAPQYHSGTSRVIEIARMALMQITMRLARDLYDRLLRDFEMLPYTYKKLTTLDSIRVLQILPGEGNAPLVCNLVETRSSETRYEALPYAWGVPTLSKCIHEYSSGTIIRVTRNLYQALQTFRKPTTSLTSSMG